MKSRHLLRHQLVLGLLILLITLSACTSRAAVPAAEVPATKGPAAESTAYPLQPNVAETTAAPTQSEMYPPPAAQGAPTDQPAATQPTAAESPNAPAVTAGPTARVDVPFDGKRAFEDVTYQMALGPRVPGSEAHNQVVDWMQKQLKDSGWTVELQETTRMGHPVRNVIAKREPEQKNAETQWVLIGAHFDSRMKADKDPDPAKQDQPVPAANDGASGVAVLLELARVLPKDLNQQIWLVFFDAEDQGDLPGWDWLLGSRAVADALPGKPDAAIILDMIGDADLNIFKEQNSNPILTQEIWNTAAQLGYTQAFKPTSRWSMIDDHTPFLEKGIRAVDIIDFDYPAWHTTQDTTDKVSAQSLQTVGDTMLHWLVQTMQK